MATLNQQASDADGRLLVHRIMWLRGEEGRPGGIEIVSRATAERTVAGLRDKYGYQGLELYAVEIDPADVRRDVVRERIV